jgi:Fe-S cluster assembly ATP-binding protein
MLEIKGLAVGLEEEEKQILKGVDLKIGAGEVHAIMGPNVSGKSTLSYVLSGKDGYEVCILDETDSGLDVDAMKLVSHGVNALRDAGRSFLVITHYQRLLDHIKPDVVHIMAGGKIIKSGGPELALEVENNGYADLLAEVA